MRKILFFFLMLLIVGCVIVPKPKNENSCVIALVQRGVKMKYLGRDGIKVYSTYEIMHLESEKKFKLGVYENTEVKPYYNLPSGMYEKLKYEMKWVSETKFNGKWYRNEFPINSKDYSQDEDRFFILVPGIVSVHEIGAVYDNHAQVEKAKELDAITIVEKYFQHPKINKRWPDMEFELIGQ